MGTFEQGQRGGRGAVGTEKLCAAQVTRSQLYGTPNFSYNLRLSREQIEECLLFHAS